MRRYVEVISVFNDRANELVPLLVCTSYNADISLLRVTASHLSRYDTHEDAHDSWQDLNTYNFRKHVFLLEMVTDVVSDMDGEGIDKLREGRIIGVGTYDIEEDDYLW